MSYQGAVFNATFGEVIKTGKSDYNFGRALKYDEPTNTLSVDVADEVTSGDNRPVSSDAVYVEVGNIEILLSTI